MDIINCCEYCKTVFKTKSALNNHLNKAKYCLLIQKKIEPKEDLFKCDNCEKILSTKQNLEIHKKKCEIILIEEEKEEVFKCEYCEKILSTKRNLDTHLTSCVEKKDQEIIEKDNEIQIRDKEIIEKDKIIIKINIQLENFIEQEEIHREQLEKQEKVHKDQIEKQEEIYREQLEKQEEQIKDLQNKLEKLANKAIERPTTVTNTTTNNNLNITSSLDFDNLDIIRDAIQNRLNVNHVVDGQKGLAQFVVDTILTDEDGKLLYVCTDPSRQIFKYKNGAGEIMRDIEARKLTSYMVDGGIKKKSVEIAAEWYKEDDDVDLTKYEIMINPQEKILNICSDNNGFRRKLASITSVV
jgi:hypothetical protein